MIGCSRLRRIASQKDAFRAPQSNDLAITKNMVGLIQKYYSRKITLVDIAASGIVGQSKCCTWL